MNTEIGMPIDPDTALLKILCQYLDSGRLPRGLMKKAIRKRLGKAWNEFEQLRLEHMKWNPKSKNAAEIALARMTGSTIMMLTGDNDRTGRDTLKAMRTLKLCLDLEI